MANENIAYKALRMATALATVSAVAAAVVYAVALLR